MCCCRRMRSLQSEFTGSEEEPLSSEGKGVANNEVARVPGPRAILGKRDEQVAVRYRDLPKGTQRLNPTGWEVGVWECI